MRFRMQEQRSQTNLGGWDFNGFFGGWFHGELGDSIRGGEFSVILLIQATELDRNLLWRDVSVSNSMRSLDVRM